MTSRIIRLLLVEDNPDHAELMLRSLAECGLPLDVTVLSDGESAIRFLLRRKGFEETAACAPPDIILLDLRVPRMDGMEVLRAVKADQALQQIPVVVVSTSAVDKDITAAYRSGASRYLLKPVSTDDLRQTIDTFLHSDPIATPHRPDA
jgi:CheY-like chemotaxis protein